MNTAGKDRHPLVRVGQGTSRKHLYPEDSVSPRNSIDPRFLVCEPAEVNHTRSKDYLTAHALADAGALAKTLAITVERRPDEKYDRIVGYRLGEKPPRRESQEDLPEYAGIEGMPEYPGIDGEDIPF